MALIELKDVCKEFTQDDLVIRALNNINLSIEENDIYGIIGMSGAGKSTLVRCLNYLEKPTSGTVIIDGEKLGTLTERELREKRGSIAMIFQHFNLLMQKTVIDNVMFPLKLKGIKKAEAKTKALEYLKTVGLEDKAKAYPILRTELTHIRRSFPEDRSRELQSQEHLPATRRFYFAMRQPQHLTLRQPNRFCLCLKRLTKIQALRL